MTERGPRPEPGGDAGFEHWVGNGTTALHLALKATGCEGGLIAVQPNVCPNVIAAIFSSGNRPLFVDIERSRMGLDPQCLSQVLDSVGAVVAVHSFGVPCLIDRLRALATARRIPLIEDCAQAEGARYEGREVGFFGDIAVFSYGAGKIVDAGGGGRIVTRDRVLEERIIASIADLPSVPDVNAAGELSITFKRLYNEEYPDRLADHRVPFTAMLRDLARLLLCRAGTDTSVRCAEARVQLQANIEARRAKARQYGGLLKNLPGIELLPMPEGAVPWRYNIWMEPGYRNGVFKALLGSGVSVSTWYPNFARFLAADSFETRATPIADWLDEGIMNLWLDGETNQQMIENSAMSIAQATFQLRCRKQ